MPLLRHLPAFLPSWLLSLPPSLLLFVGAVRLV